MSIYLSIFLCFGYFTVFHDNNFIILLMSILANLSQIRPTLTSQHHRKRSSIRPCEHSRNTSYSKNIDQQRPNTTACGRNLNHLNYKTIDFAEEELRKTFKKQMNLFIDNKIRSFTHKRQQEIIPEDNFAYTLRSTINPEGMETSKQFKNSPRNIKQMKLSNFLMKHSPVKEKVVAQPYLKNDKEKISRIISKRLQQEQQYKSLKTILKNRCTSQPYKRRITIRQELKKSLNNEAWMIGWVQDKKLQENRYRKRLVFKHERRNLTIDF